MRRKYQLIMDAGGRCARCGYRRNLAALTWHHIDATKKSFNLDMRALSNRSQPEILAEVAKCILLCANCHAEAHFPELALSAMNLQNLNSRKRGR
jgi:predicted HNH restriction endonuclease